MLYRQEKQGKIAITQPTHAWLSGQLARTSRKSHQMRNEIEAELSLLIWTKGMARKVWPPEATSSPLCYNETRSRIMNGEKGPIEHGTRLCQYRTVGSSHPDGGGIGD